MNSRSQPSPWLAVPLGLLFIGVGVLLGIASSGRLGSPPAAAAGQMPGWVAICIPLLFGLSGVAIIVGATVAGGSGPDGNLPADAPLWARLTQYLLALAIVGSLGSVFSWVAFGSGPRAFTMSSSISAARPANPTTGRIAFGFGAGLIWIIFAAIAITGMRGLFNAGKGGKVSSRLATIPGDGGRRDGENAPGA